MVYRYESDEDAFAERPRPGSELSTIGDAGPARTGPSPSRFPTPSLPRTARVAPPTPPGQVPPRSAPPAPPPPARTATTTPQPLDPPESRRAPEPGRGGGRLWQVLIGGAAVLVLLALCGLAGAALLAERTSQPQVTPSLPAAAPSPSSTERQDIDSRDTDPAPLTAKEVFPGRTLTIGDGEEPYQVLKTQSSASCPAAATGEVADLLVRLGCSQVVRATLRSPGEEYLLTAGLFNLTDLATAQRVRDRLRELLDGREGRFRGMPAGDRTEALTDAPSRVGWQVRGHYLAYCLVVRADGEPVKAGDPKVREVLYDLIELHLDKQVLERRATGGSTGQAKTTPGPGRTD
ncbi:hypothetical protein C5N14_02165 [Micromonospora sp. MW-13]|uniref:hypothetical protein n=1 Tax=unclassified Micromonospora TaxID=2617518 RepID=UPI000EE916A2|nr:MULTISPECIES: hypothetical protein [unclassified Micromonospora]MCX4469981.1 hypothetical protein [Micromonospora sp. NBC_01655]RGC70654.1 hypothetical protein C5N14_02165 [Micromonospora sp. MW-13]